MRKVDPAKHEEKRQQILAAAGKCFARKGFQGATISDICAEANISPGHLYHYFKSKNAIVEAMAETRLNRASEVLSKILEGPDIISSLVSAFKPAAAHSERTNYVTSLDMLAEAVRNPALAKIMEEHSRALRAQIANFLRKGQALGQIDTGLDPGLTASVLLCVADGTKTLTLRNPQLDIDQSVDVLKTLFVRFLVPPKP
jgi:AcrR family transcriptional regulator